MPGDMAWVRFYQNSVYQSFRSEKEGRPIYEPVDFIEIRFPGDDKQIVDRAVKPEDKERWDKQWGAYQRGMNMEVDGTPLAVWPQLKVSEVTMLQSYNIYSVDQLAELDDLGLQKIGLGARDMQKRAQYFLQEATARSASANTKARNDEQAAEIETLHARIGELEAAALKADVEEADDTVKPKRTPTQAQLDGLARGRATAAANRAAKAA